MWGKSKKKKLQFLEKGAVFSNLKDLDVKNSSADMISISSSELAQITALASDTTSLNRQDLRSQNYNVEALNKERKQRKNYDPNNGFDDLNQVGGENQIEASEGSGLNLDSHPELPYTGGKPADQIYFPDSVIESGQIPESLLSSAQKEELKKQKDRKKEQLEKSLKQRMAAKFKLGFAKPKNAPKVSLKQAPRSRPLPKFTPY